MERQALPWLVPSVFAVALGVLLLDAAGGPGWGASSAHVALAVRGEQLAASPLYDLVARAFVLLPAGEPGFRLGILAALLGAIALAGVVAAARALLPKDPIAGCVGALLLVVTPAFREAAAFAAPDMLAAAGATWFVAYVLRFVRERDVRAGVAALCCSIVVMGSAVWLGAACLLVFVLWTPPRGVVLACIMTLEPIVGVVLWGAADGEVPRLVEQLGAPLAIAGAGAGAVVVGAGLIGVSFAALTGLAHARGVAALVAIGLVLQALFGGTSAAVLALLAIGVAILPSALVRLAAAETTGRRRMLTTLGGGVPLVLIALLVGATFTVDDPGATPATLAHDLVDAQPPGKGIFVTTRRTTWLALQHEMTVAGARPDLALVPPLPAQQADTVVANALRAGTVVGADAPAFGRLDVRRAIPRGRGFQLVGELPAEAPRRVLGPATYETAEGRGEAIVLALERARFEGASGRLDAAARAAGLEQRFGAADLAILGSTVPSKARPALFGFLPMRGAPAAWWLDAFGDDLAWVAGIAIAELPASAPIPRRLHGYWRAILSGTMTPDDPEIAALGPEAVRATKALFTKQP